MPLKIRCQSYLGRGGNLLGPLRRLKIFIGKLLPVEIVPVFVLALSKQREFRIQIKTNKEDLKYGWPLGPCPDDHASLSDLDSIDLEPYVSKNGMCPLFLPISNRCILFLLSPVYSSKRRYSASMKRNRSSCPKPRAARISAGAVLCAFLVMIGLTSYVSEVFSIEIPSEVQKKAVSLSHSRTAAEHFFIGNCGKCHKVPDPANPVTPKSDCTSGIPEVGVGMVKDYMAGVKAGKNLYESYCGRCHTLIDPGSHTFDYWSKNICTSDSCMVKRRLNTEEEQQLLLYLSSHAKRQER